MPTKPSIPTRRGGLLYAQGAHGALHLCCQVLVHTVTSSVTPRFQEIVATAMPNLAGAKGGCPGDVLLRPTGPSVLRSSEDLRSLLSWIQPLLRHGGENRSRAFDEMRPKCVQAGSALQHLLCRFRCWGPRCVLEPKWLRTCWGLPWVPEYKDRQRNLSSNLSASSPCKAPQSTAMIRLYLLTYSLNRLILSEGLDSGGLSGSLGILSCWFS